jgi:hypothetical protein
MNIHFKCPSNRHVCQRGVSRGVSLFFFKSQVRAISSTPVCLDLLQLRRTDFDKVTVTKKHEFVSNKIINPTDQ